MRKMREPGSGEVSGRRTAYRKAFEVALEKFRQQDPCFAASHTGTAYDFEEGCFAFDSMGREARVTYPGGEAYWAADGKALSMDWHLIAINYLARGDGRPLTGRLISYRELDGGKVFFPNLKEKTIDRLAAVLGPRPSPDIQRVFALYQGTPVEGCDLGATFYLFPCFPVTVKLWLADDEFPPSANILFDAAAGGYLHTEDIAAAASIVANCLLRGDKKEDGGR